MLSHLQCTRVHLPNQLKIIIKFIEPLYDKCVSVRIRHRRNISQCIMSDVMIISLLLLQKVFHFNVQSYFYNYLTQECFPKGTIPEKSRFNRICNRDGEFLRIIRLHLLYNYFQTNCVIIDSFPISLCKPVRNLRSVVLSPLSDIGYNSTKQTHYFGLKANMEVSIDGVPLTYSITSPSIHDVKVAKTLINQYACQVTLGDKGYLSNENKHWAKLRHVIYWTPKRSNMKGYSKSDDRFLRRLRRRIETSFSKWNLKYNVEDNRGRCRKGFFTRFEQTLLMVTTDKVREMYS